MIHLIVGNTGSGKTTYSNQLKKETKVQLFYPLSSKYPDRTIFKELELLIQKGFTRIQRTKDLEYLEDILEKKPKWTAKKVKTLKANAIMVLVDRFVVNDDECD